MAYESVYKYGTTKTLTTTGASITNNQLSTAAGVTYSQTDTLDYPDAVFVLGTAGFGGTPTSGTTIDLYLRPLNIDSTISAPAPPTGASTATYKGQYVGSFVLTANGFSGITYQCIGYDIPRSGEAYLFNNGTGVSANANWTLKITPRTIGPA